MFNAYDTVFIEVFLDDFPISFFICFQIILIKRSGYNSSRRPSYQITIILGIVFDNIILSSCFQSVFRFMIQAHFQRMKSIVELNQYKLFLRWIHPQRRPLFYPFSIVFLHHQIPLQHAITLDITLTVDIVLLSFIFIPVCIIP